MIRILEGDRKGFVLDTINTTYVFSLLPTGQLEHDYYGRKITVESFDDIKALEEVKVFEPGNSLSYDNDHMEYTLEDVRLEAGFYGKSDIREPFCEVTAADGSTTLDFVFEDAVISDHKEEFEELPGSYGDDAETLKITLKDKNNGYTLELYYYVYADSDVIGRSSKFINTGSENVILRRLMSNNIDIFENGVTVTDFTGAWSHEMNRTDTVVSAGNYTFSSVTGGSSNRANPFFFVSLPESKVYDFSESANAASANNLSRAATENTGECIAFNLIYSGNHYESVSVNSYGKTRICQGINPATFRWVLTPGEAFQAPEAVFVYSDKGTALMSQRMTDFVSEHIVRGSWKHKDRPVLLNSWEANYFDIDEGKLVSLAKKGKEAGIELFVMDDGWFGERSDDHRSLGDWTENQKKLPHGLKGIADRIHEQGLMFGIWVEPEMVNVDSDLYRAHPDWTIDIPDKAHTEGRTQRILDLANPEVTDYMISQMERVFGSAQIDYVKWDMNRIFSDYYSRYLPADRQGETAHRYILGLYRMMKTLTEDFPDILFEGCASGGCRFDLGILSYFPQIWASDDTDAVARIDIQEGYSYGYPLKCVTGHVSASPNHQTLRVTPLNTRFNVAAFSNFGYELNLLDLSKDELEEIKQQITIYKKWRDVLQNGHFYRLKKGNHVQWLVVSEDKRRAVGMLLVREPKPAMRYENFRLQGLDPELTYHFYNVPVSMDVKAFGSLINTMAPVHVKQDSLVHNVIAKFVKLTTETESVTAHGDLLMSAGVNLKPSFVGTGYNDQIRVMTDYASRMYFIEAVDNSLQEVKC